MNLANADLDRRLIRIMVVPIGHNNLFNEQFSNISCVKELPYYEIPRSLINSLTSIKFLNQITNHSLLFEYCRYDSCTNLMNELDNFVSNKRILIILGLINYPDYVLSNNKSLEEEFEYFERKYPYTIFKRLCVFNYHFDTYIDSSNRIIRPLYNDPESLLIFPPQGEIEGETKWTIHYRESLSLIGSKLITYIDRQIEQCEEYRLKNITGPNLSLITPWDDFEDLLANNPSNMSSQSSNPSTASSLSSMSMSMSMSISQNFSSSLLSAVNSSGLNSGLTSSLNSPSGGSLSSKNRPKKKQYYSARIRKWMGDLCMQLCSPLDAIDYYVSAISENRGIADNNLWLASALDGYAQAILLIRKLQDNPNDKNANDSYSTNTTDDIRKSFSNSSNSSSQLLEDVIGKDFKTLPPLPPLPDEVEGVGLPEKVFLLAEERMNEALGIITDTISLLTASTLSSSSNLALSSGGSSKNSARLGRVSSNSNLPLQNTIYNPITLLIIVEAEMCFRMAKFILTVSGNFYMKAHHVCDYIQRGISSIYNRKYLTIIPNGVVISFQNYIQSQQYHQTTQSLQQLMYIEQSIGLGIDLKIEILMYAVILLLNSEKYLGLQLKRKAMFYLIQVVRVASDSNDFEFATQIMLRINDLIAEKSTTSNIDLNKFTDNNIYLTEDSTPNTWISIKKMIYTYGIYNSHGSENTEASTRFLSNLLNILTRIELEHFEVFDIMSKYNSKILGLDKFSMKKKSTQTVNKQPSIKTTPLTEESLRLHSQPSSDKSKLSPTNTSLSNFSVSNSTTISNNITITNTNSFSISSPTRTRSIISSQTFLQTTHHTSAPYSQAYSVNNDNNNSKHHLSALMNPYSIKKKSKKSYRKVGNIKIREINEENDFLGHHVAQIAQSITSLPISQKLSSLISTTTTEKIVKKSNSNGNSYTFSLGDKFLRNIFGDSFVDFDDEVSLLTFNPAYSTNNLYQMISLDTAKDILKDVASKLTPSIIPIEQLEAIFGILYPQCSSLINDPFSYQNNTILSTLENENQNDDFTTHFSSNIISGGKRRSSDAIKYESIITPSPNPTFSSKLEERSSKFKQFLNSPSPFLLLPIIIFFIRPLILNSTYKLIPLEEKLNFTISTSKSKKVIDYTNLNKFIENLLNNSIQLIDKEIKKIRLEHHEDNEEESNEEKKIDHTIKKNSSLFYDPFANKSNKKEKIITPLWSINKISYFIMILSNPLNYPLNLSQVIPIVAYVDESTDTSTSSSFNNNNSNLNFNMNENYLFGDNYILTYPIDIEIPPRTEFFQLSLGIKPLRPGRIKLLGLSYYIGNAYQRFLLDPQGNILYNLNKSEEKFLFYSNQNNSNEWKGVLGKMKEKIEKNYQNFTPSCTIVDIVDTACDISISTSFNSCLIDNSKAFELAVSNSVSFNLKNQKNSKKNENISTSYAPSTYHKSTRGSSVSSYSNLNHSHSALTITSPPLYTNIIPYTNKSINSLNITNPFSNFHSLKINDTFTYNYTLFCGESKKENISINILPLINQLKEKKKKSPQSDDKSTEFEISQYFYDIRVRVVETEKVRPIRINKILEKEKERLSSKKYSKEDEELKKNSYLLYDFNSLYQYFNKISPSNASSLEENKQEENFNTSVEIISVNGIKSLDSILNNNHNIAENSLCNSSNVDLSLYFHHKHNDIKSLQIEIDVLFLSPSKISSLSLLSNCINYLTKNDNKDESQLKEYHENLSTFLNDFKESISSTSSSNSTSISSYFYLKKIELNFNLNYEALSIISNIQPFIPGFQEELLQLEEQLQEVLIDNPYTNSYNNNFYYQQYSLVKNYNKVFFSNLMNPNNKQVLSSIKSSLSSSPFSLTSLTNSSSTINNNIISNTIDFYLKNPLTSSASSPNYSSASTSTSSSIKLKLLNNQLNLIFTFNNNFSSELYISFNKKSLLEFLEINHINNNSLHSIHNINALNSYYLTFDEFYSYYLDSISENPVYSPILFTVAPSSSQKLTLIYSLNPNENNNKNFSIDDVNSLNLFWATVTFNNPTLTNFSSDDLSDSSSSIDRNLLIRNGSFILSEKLNRNLTNSLTRRLLKVSLTSSSTLLSSTSIIHSNQKYSNYTTSLLNLLLNLSYSPQPAVSFHPNSLLINSFLQAYPLIFVKNSLTSISPSFSIPMNINKEYQVNLNQLFSIKSFIEYYLPITINSTKSIAYDILEDKLTSDERDVDVEFFTLIYNISHPNSLLNTSSSSSSSSSLSSSILSSNLLYTPSISSSYMIDGKVHTIKKMKRENSSTPLRTSLHNIKLRFLHSGRFLVRLFIKIKDPHPEGTSSSWFTSSEPVIIFVSNN